MQSEVEYSSDFLKVTLSFMLIVLAYLYVSYGITAMTRRATFTADFMQQF